MIDTKRQNVGMTPIAGSVRTDVDSLFIANSESPDSMNFLHHRGRLTPRPGLKEYASWSSVSATHRQYAWTGLFSMRFEYGTAYLCAANAKRFYTWDGATRTDRTGSLSFSGTDQNPWDMCYGIDGSTLSPEGAVFAANGADDLLVWRSASGSAAASVTRLTYYTSYAGGPVQMSPRYCTMFNGRLVIGHITESGTTHATRTRASKVNSFLTFDTAGGAQVVDHADTPGDITGLASDDSFLYVLKSDAIILGQDTGSTITFGNAIRVGCLSGRSFQSITPFVKVFLGQDNVYTLSGGNAQPIGGPIQRDLFSNLNYTRTRQIVAHTEYGKSLYRLWIPVSGSDYATRCYVYNWNENVWFTENYPTEIHSSETVIFGTGTTIGSLTGTIGSYNNQIGDWGQGGSAPTVVVGTKYGSSDYRLHYTSAVSYDDATERLSINPYRQSKDFRLNPDGYATVYQVTLTYSSSTSSVVTVSISTDRGNTWESLTKTLDAANNRQMSFHFVSTGIYHRVRIATQPVTGAESNPIEFHSAELGFANRRPAR